MGYYSSNRSGQKMNNAEAKLLARLKAGEPDAVRQWFAHYHDRLLAFVSKKIDNPKDAEELVQETFMNCLKHLPLFRGGSSIFTWMCSIANHEVADFYRKKYAKKALHTVPLADFLLHTKVENAHEVAEKVQLVLSKMRSDYKELLLLKYVDGKRVKEIAAELGRTVKSIEADLFRAREEFRLLYETI